MTTPSQKVTSTRKENMKRKSIKSTYDSVKDGPQYQIASFVNGKRISENDIADPFVNHTITIGIRDILRGLLSGKIVVNVCINGKNRRIEEDVLELDDQYLAYNSTRREKWNTKIEKSIKKLVKG